MQKQASETGGKKRRKQRGGRVKGTWKAADPSAVLEFRKSNKISRSRLAGVLGVSTTTIQNWETGVVVATPKAQQELADLMKQGAAAFLPPPGRLVALVSGPGPTISTTGAIVVGYLQSLKAPLSQAELIGLIRSVRLALS